MSMRWKDKPRFRWDYESKSWRLKWFLVRNAPPYDHQTQWLDADQCMVDPNIRWPFKR